MTVCDSAVREWTSAVSSDNSVRGQASTFLATPPLEEGPVRPLAASPSEGRQARSPATPPSEEKQAHAPGAPAAESKLCKTGTYSSNFFVRGEISTCSRDYSGVKLLCWGLWGRSRATVGRGDASVTKIPQRLKRMRSPKGFGWTSGVSALTVAGSRVRQQSESVVQVPVIGFTLSGGSCVPTMRSVVPRATPPQQPGLTMARV